jgi:hypothetical protein
MKTFPVNESPLSMEFEKLGTRREGQSLFSLLLEIESRLRKEARANPRPRTPQSNHPSKAWNLRRSQVDKLSRYIE